MRCSYRLVLTAVAQNIRDSEETLVYSVSRKKQGFENLTIISGRIAPQLKNTLDKSAFII
jgi:hypothetical protein